ncbi:aspartate aminotransferase family protein [uncultured Faecalibaculum sp.]|uniref:aspartate aminotransferase family protein n=2 Tax=uncultured Faecalibaculum sp. TaxID=1729681 RepID=UPI002636F991|nr:aspartate aminotransferase family protein [uncultured Faecalibaculum sp.]
MDFNTLKKRENKSLMHTYGRFDIALDHGKGSKLYDLDGNEYIDLTSGIGVNALGHGHEALVTAIREQAGKLMQASNLFYTEPMVDAAERLADSTGMAKVFFANSGAEANEGMIKIARKYSADKYGPSRTKILTLKNSFHGRTVATLEATGQDKFHQNFYPFTGGFDYVEAGSLEDLKRMMDDPAVAGIMMELIQGESGVRPLDPAFVQEAARLAREKDILFMADEVQTGIGRTGSLFCWQQYGIEPDLTSCAKALGGGVPIGAVLAADKVADVLEPGDHGTTFGGNPLASAAARTVLDIVDQPAFLADVKEKGQYFMDRIRNLNKESVQDVRGLGLMIGIQVGADKVSEYLAALQKKGVLALKAGTDTIRLLPPLIITKEEIDQAVAAMDDVFE